MNINFKTQRLLQSYNDETKPIKVSVHDFIQSVVFTPFPQDSELQVERLTLAGNIYESIGFKRKAAFYRRFAALKSVTVNSDWQACYDALLESLKGFGLTLDPIEYQLSLSDRYKSVWPGLHVQLMEELITCCKKIQNAQAGSLAIRHMSFVLHTLDFYLSNSKKKDFAKELEEASTIFGEDSPVPLTLSSGFVIPTVNLTKYPLCLKLEPLPLALPLRPVRLKYLRRRSLLSTPTTGLEVSSDNPFIFTPITNHSSLIALETRRTASNSLITDVVWVQDEPCSTLIVLKNTMPFELIISSIKLLTDGVPLETRSSSLNMEPNSDVKTINLLAVPRQLPRDAEDSKPLTNKLEIFGYSTHVLGVKSNCRLDMIPMARFPSQYVVEVCPPLPRLNFKFPLEHTDQSVTVDHVSIDQVDKELVVMEIKVHIRLNDKLETELVILNCSNVDIEYLHMQEKQQPSSTNQTVQGKRLVDWDDELFEQLNSSPLKAGRELSLPMTIAAPKENLGNSDHITTYLTFEFSGGFALKEMYCRKCCIKFTIYNA